MMTIRSLPHPSSPRKRGPSALLVRPKKRRWIPAFAGMTISASFALTTSFAHADTGVGVDTWRANKLDPTAGAASQDIDERGTSWLTAGQHRSPTGNLYMCPAESPEVSEHGE